MLREVIFSGNWISPVAPEAAALLLVFLFSFISFPFCTLEAFAVVPVYFGISHEALRLGRIIIITATLNALLFCLSHLNATSRSSGLWWSSSLFIFHRSPRSSMIEPNNKPATISRHSVRWSASKALTRGESLLFMLPGPWRDNDDPDSDQHNLCVGAGLDRRAVFDFEK